MRLIRKANFEVSFKAYVIADVDLVQDSGGVFGVVMNVEFQSVGQSSIQTILKLRSITERFFTIGKMFIKSFVKGVNCVV